MTIWHALHITINREAAEAAYAVLDDFGAGSVAISDPALVDMAQEMGWGDYYSSELSQELSAAQIKISCYFSQPKSTIEIAQLQQRLTNLHQFGLEPGVVKIESESVNEEDWASSWKAYYNPVRIGRVVIKPSWTEELSQVGPVEAIDTIVCLDPGMAFGTGTHPTTTMCLDALQKIDLAGKEVWDIGTGSGVLAIVAAKFGAQVSAVDIDPVAVKVAAENRDLNDVDFNVFQGSIVDLKGKANVIIANIIADVIIALLPDIYERLTPGGIFIASGVITGREAEVRTKAESLGLTVSAQNQEQEWISFSMRKEN